MTNEEILGLLETDNRTKKIDVLKTISLKK